ncbi:MAG: hypothetical protein G01um101448_242 [Parcubacteria group bacterium Gr01-1014_48]|nr:MAG: hypothetical protein Greene041614_74 [Parcubacteria group bacterium Greene0416_14]TSC74244.1 MAG: hypothetical protein G01um101448_242 [Parcubacteria group bacterium Gr01-1014_48]TSD01515.1 MAG: hypothetical protein Greene101415_231 [Parcubacteria group bacterium Greene1014_15]TSD08337.1 MAG: hypothetical protein Greene07144_188 [Parcubacteria group bacterium Greene0714_4]
MGGAAKELGIAVEDFSKTSLGTLTIVLVIWKMIGNDLIQLIVGLLWFMVVIPVWIKIFYRMCLVQKIAYAENGKTRVSVEHHDDSDTDARRWAMTFVFAVLVGIGFLVMFA